MTEARGSDSDPARSRHAELRDRRLVEVYDAECPWSRDDDYFLAIVDRTPRARVLDLGCGTGRLALGMARAGHTVTGVDPASASLDAARTKPDAERVTWIEGTSSQLSEAAFEIAVMTSHVAQFFVGDADWSRTLADLKRALVRGGTLAFDSRDPDARAWERWNRIDSRRLVPLPDARVVRAWTEVTAFESSTAHFTHHYVYPDGVALESTAALRFRSEEELRASLSDAGFAVESIHGGWRREPVGRGDGELLVTARA